MSRLAGQPGLKAVSKQPPCVIILRHIQAAKRWTVFRSLAINIIGLAGYSQKQSWSHAILEPEPDREVATDRLAYFSTLFMVAKGFIVAALIPARVLRLPIMPRALQTLGYNLQKIPKYTNSVLEEERQVLESGSSARNNFLTLLLRLSDEEKRRQSGFSLSDEELSGNLFVFTTAGFETVSNTIGYAVIMLAAHPECQAWLREELQDLDLDSTTWAYDDVFPKCRRTLAVMLETLRLFSPVHHIMRSTRKPQQLTSDRGTHFRLPPMDFFVGVTLVHMDPRYWSLDPEAFRPSRWIDGTSKIITPPLGTFRPWSGGPRICPGLKMFEVEFVATVATLFRSTKCEPIPTAGLHRPEDLQQGLKDLAQGSVTKLALQLRDPKAVQIRWVQD